MKYLLLLYEHEEQLVQPSFDENGLHTAIGQLSDELLRTSGRLLAGAQLQAADTVATLSRQHNEVIVTAGPPVEMTAQLSAFYLIEAHDLNDAIQVAAQLPQPQHGCIEVRPVAA